MYFRQHSLVSQSTFTDSHSITTPQHNIEKMIQPQQNGLTSASWNQFLLSLKPGSQVIYAKRLEHFLIHCGNCFNHVTDLEKVITYFQQARLQVNEDGSPLTAPTSMRGWFSVLKKWFLHMGWGCLSTKVPIVETLIGQWEKSHVVTKAKTFSVAQLVEFHGFPDDPETLLLKAYSVIGMAFAGRTCDIYDILFKEIERVPCEGGIRYILEYDHSKRTGAKTTDARHQIITGNISLNWINNGLSLIVIYISR